MDPRVAAALAVVLGIAATTVPAQAAPEILDGYGRAARPSAAWTGFAPDDHLLAGQPRVGCPTSSAAEGNANQQTRPVKQYGQVAGGYRC